MKTLLYLVPFFVFSSIFAQPGTVDMSFNPGDVGFGIGDGFNNTVYSVAVQADGKILVGGFFTLYNGKSANRIVRINENGSLDESFNTGTGFSGAVWSIKLQSDSKILVGGTFTSYNGTSVNRLARLNTDGSLDTAFEAGTELSGVFDYGVYSIAIQPDAKIMVGGTFSRRIARFTPEGNIDNEFIPGTGFNIEITNNSILISSILVQSDGKILIGGNFTNYNGTSINGIVRLNPGGVIDGEFNSGAGFKGINDGIGSVIAMALQPDGKIVAGGSFTDFNGKPANYISRLNTNGSLDTTFITGSGFNAGSDVRSVAVQTNGKILVGGNFSSYNGTSVKGIARLNPDGSMDNDFNTGTGFEGYIQSLSIQNNGKVLAGGAFNIFNGIRSERIALLNLSGEIDNTFNTGTAISGSYSINSEVVSSVGLRADGGIIVGGGFYRYNTTTVSNFVLLNPDGSINTDFITGKGFNSRVWSIAVQADEKILVGGEFASYNESEAAYIVRLNSDGSSDTDFITGTGLNNSVRSIILQPDQKIVVGGNFTSFNGIDVNRIIRLNHNGSLDTEFNSGQGFSSIVRSIALQSDGKLLVGGLFTSYNGTASNRIVRLNANGTLDTTFNVGTGFNQAVVSLAIQQDGKILAGGAFSGYNGTQVNRIARLNPNGSLDTTFITGTGFNNVVRSVLLQPNGKIIAAGDFPSYNGTVVNHLTRLNSDGTLDNTFISGVGFNNVVYAAALQPDGQIIAGGNFTAYSGTGRNRIARINGDPNISTQTDFIKTNSLRLFPNPVSHGFRIDAQNQSILSITLFDLQGKKVFFSSHYEGEVNIAFLPKGIYLVKIEFDTYTEIQKMIKQ